LIDEGVAKQEKEYRPIFQTKHHHVRDHGI